MHEVFVDDFVDVMLIHIGVPDAFGIDRDHWALRTAIHATRVVNPALSRGVEFERFDFFLGVIAHGLRTLGGTAGFAALALVYAKKYVVFVVVHIEIQPDRRPPL